MFSRAVRQLRVAAPLACATGVVGGSLERQRKCPPEKGTHSGASHTPLSSSAPLQCEGWFGAKPKGPYTVTYFDLPALGEVVRIMFVLGKLEFQDRRPTFKEWGDLKPKTKWGQLPFMTTPDGKEMAQTKSMVRYLGKVVPVGGKKLYPADPTLAFDVDEIMDSFEDLRMLFVPTMRMSSEDEKKKARTAIMADGGPGDVLLKKIDSAAASGAYLVGSSLTVADLWCFMFVNFMRSGFWDYIDPDFIKKYPKLDSIQKGVKSQPLIKEYYAKVDLKAKPAYKFFVEE